MSDIRLEEAVNGIVEELNQKIFSIKAAAETVANNKAVEEVVEKATVVLTNASNKVIETAKTISNPEEILKGIEIVRGKSEQLYNYAISKIEEFKNLDIKNNVEEFVRDRVDEVKDSEIVQDVKETVQNVQEFVANSELNKTVEEMKFISNELREKTISTLKDWLNADGENQ